MTVFFNLAPFEMSDKRAFLGFPLGGGLDVVMGGGGGPGGGGGGGPMA